MFQISIVNCFYTSLHLEFFKVCYNGLQSPICLYKVEYNSKVQIWFTLIPVLVRLTNDPVLFILITSFEAKDV